MTSAAPPRLLFAAALALAGCETFSPAQTCDMSPQDNPPVVYAGGGIKNGVYATTPLPDGGPTPQWPWYGPLLLLDGGERYKLLHGLPTTPQWVAPWISFSPDGAGGGSTIAVAVGNELQIEGIDDNAIHIANYSCSQYYVLVTAGVAGTNPPSPQ